MGEAINERTINCEGLLDRQNTTAGQQNSRVWHSTVTINNCNTMPVTSVNGSTQDYNVPDSCNNQRRSVNMYRGLRILDMSSQWKEFNNSHGQWTCFFCGHVQDGAFLIGLWHLMMQSVLLITIYLAISHMKLGNISDDQFRGELLEMYPSDIKDVQAINCTTTPCFLATHGTDEFYVNNNYPVMSFGNFLEKKGLNSDDINMVIFITLCTFVMTLLLLYGVAKAQPSHLMPFFFLQVFDFCIACITMIGYLSDLPNIRQHIRKKDRFLFQATLLDMNKKCLMFSVVLIFILTFLFKAYCINVVWRCYKYFMGMYDGSRWTMRSAIGSSIPVDQESQTLVVAPDLPDYNTAMTDPQYRKKDTFFPEPPPTYDMAVTAYNVQTNILEELRRSIDQPAHSSTEPPTSSHRQ